MIGRTRQGKDRRVLNHINCHHSPRPNNQSLASGTPHRGSKGNLNVPDYFTKMLSQTEIIAGALNTA